MDRDDEIFADAVELPRAARAAFLDRSCDGDPAQRARIEALLAANDGAGSFLEQPLAPARPLSAEEKPGDVISRYRLIEKIGEGGCGSVYLAEQAVPVRRRVALKVIKLGMDTRAVIARFEAERQALALMDHPDIARVFDAGATDAGRPFFVMELVEGVPITTFCDEHALPVAARLELFARVCLALQHAHQKGIIHRDIKPSNILVARRDGVPTPKVIDFGIAKATQDRLTEQTLVTGVDQFIGTPAYMSPEQADHRDAAIDTRSDVYSLGVLLYELLTSRLPFDRRTIGLAGVEEIRRITREVEPPRPSVRLRTLGGTRTLRPWSRQKATVPPAAEPAPVADHVPLRAGRPGHEPTLDAIAATRSTTTKQLSSILRGDLDWIVMRCLEKDPDRRYSTARELADDVLRHLRREPVLARPPSTRYRVERFVARNRLACASAAAIALALVVGTVVSVRQAVRATRAEHTANAERDAANAAGRAEALARADAQRRQEQAEDLLAFMLGDFRTELQKIGRLQLLDTVGEKAMSYFAALDPRDLTDTALARQAKALTQIGEIRLDQARYADAAAAFIAAYERAAALVVRHPRNGDMLFERAQAEYWIGFVARKRGDFAAEREWLTRYRDSAVALVEVEGKTPRAQLELTYGHHNLAVLELERGNLANARVGFLAEKAGVEELLVAQPGDTQLQFAIADAASWLGTVAERDGDYAEALKNFSESTFRFEELVRLEPVAVQWKRRLAQSVAFCGTVQALLGRSTEASASYARAKALLAALVALDPKNQEWQVESLHTQIMQITLLLASGDVHTVRAVLDATCTQLEALAAAEPSSRAFTRLLASTWRLEGFVRFVSHRAADAEMPVKRAIDLTETLTSEARADVRMLSETAQLNLLLGRIASARNEPAYARTCWANALEVISPRLADSNDWRLLDPAAQAFVLLGKAEEARPFIERLQRFGYHSLDPLAAPLLAVASLPDSGNPKP